MNRTEPESYQEFESLPARVVGVLRSPCALFKSVIGRPRWAAMMLVSLLVTAACGVTFMKTGVGRQALVDQWERTALAFGQEVDDERYATFTEMSEHGFAYAVMSALATGPVLTVVLAGLVFGVFSRLRAPRFHLRAPRFGGQAGVQDASGLDGDATFTQVLAVVAHAGVILALRQLVATPLNYSRETLASPTTLSLFFPMFDEASPPARFVGAIDLFVVWWVIVLAIGVGLLYRRSARSTALAFMGAYVGFAMLLAIAMAVSGGTV